MPTDISRGLAYKQAVQTVIVGLLLALSAAGMLISYDLYSVRRQAAERAGEILAAASVPAAQAAYALDVQLAGRVVEGVFRHPVVRQAMITDDFGSTLAELSRPVEDGRFAGVVDFLFGADGHYHLPLRHRLSESYVGQLRLRLDEYRIAASFLDRSLATLAAVVVMVAALACIMALLFYRNVTRPLLRTARNVADIDPRAPEEERVEIPAGHGRDELGALAQAMNELLDGLSEAQKLHREAREQLHRSEAYYRDLFEGSPQAYLLQDYSRALDRVRRLQAEGVGDIAAHLAAHPDKVRELAGLVDNLRVNQAAVDMYRARTSEDLLNAFSTVKSENGDDDLIRQMTAFAAGGRRYESVTANRTLTGETLHVYIRKAVVPGFEEDCSRVMTAVTDLTELRRAEEALLESHRRMTAILDSLDAHVYVSDFETYEILFMNHTMKEDFGFGLEGTPCYKSFRKRNSVCPDCPCDDLVDAEGRPLVSKVWEGHNPLTGRYYRNHDQAIRWVDGRLVHLQVAADITDIKTADDERRRLQEQLHQAQKMEAIGTLAGGIAHDFNNILSAIMGYTELTMFEVEEESNAAANLNRVMQAGQRAKELVQQILAFSRKAQQDQKPVNITPLVKESLKFLRASLPTTVEIESEIDPRAGAILADPTQIHQVIMNLCTNAAQAMKDMEGALTVRVRRAADDEGPPADTEKPAPAGRLLLEVRDTGPGMPPGAAERVFEPFFTTKPPGEGSGMGLAVVHGIVISHGGSIDVESAPGRGTVFRVLFPLIEEEVPEAEDEQAPLRAAPGGEHIMLVDDEEPLVDINRQILERLGYRVTAFTSSPAALEAFRKNPREFDLVITDQTMPRMSGEELIGELLTIRSDAPIIICTGYSSRMSAERAAEIGARRFLMKPLAPREAAQAVRSVLDESGFRRPPA